MTPCIHSWCSYVLCVFVLGLQQDAGLVAYRFNTIGVSDGISMGTDGMSYSLQSRDLIADSIETVMSAQWYDANISLPGCDKNMPGSLIAMARLNRPSIMVYGGTIKPGHSVTDGAVLDIVSAFQSYGEDHIISTSLFNIGLLQTCTVRILLLSCNPWEGGTVSADSCACVVRNQCLCCCRYCCCEGCAQAALCHDHSCESLVLYQQGLSVVGWVYFFISYTVVAQVPMLLGKSVKSSASTWYGMRALVLVLVVACTRPTQWLHLLKR